MQRLGPRETVIHKGSSEYSLMAEVRILGAKDEAGGGAQARCYRVVTLGRCVVGGDGSHQRV